MYCKNCGAPINDHLKFCGRCGTPIENYINTPVFTERFSVPASNITVPNTNSPNKSNIIIALLIIAITIITFTSLAMISKNPNSPDISLGNYSSDATSSNTYLSAEERAVLGTWHTYGLMDEQDNFEPLGRNIGTLNIYDDLTGNVGVGDIFYSFRLSFSGIGQNGIYDYYLHLNNGEVIFAVYHPDIDMFAFGDSNTKFLFQR